MPFFQLHLSYSKPTKFKRLHLRWNNVKIIIIFFLALFQPLTAGSREFEDVLNILHSSYLEPTSVTNFNYKRACLIHNELLEKEVCFKLCLL